MVVIKLVVNVSSENRSSKQLFPTPGNINGALIRLGFMLCEGKLLQHIKVWPKDNDQGEKLNKTHRQGCGSSVTTMDSKGIDFTGFWLSLSNQKFKRKITPTLIKCYRHAFMVTPLHKLSCRHCSVDVFHPPLPPKKTFKKYSWRIVCWTKQDTEAKYAVAQRNWCKANNCQYDDTTISMRMKKNGQPKEDGDGNLNIWWSINRGTHLTVW
jgi:hypothetical protein